MSALLVVLLGLLKVAAWAVPFLLVAVPFGLRVSHVWSQPTLDRRGGRTPE